MTSSDPQKHSSDGRNGTLSANMKERTAERVGYRERIAHFTWTWFTCSQSTGGLAILLSETPHQFDGIQTAGLVIFILNLVLFLIFNNMMILRWILHPEKLKKSLMNTPESFFIGSYLLTLATIIIGMEDFGVPHAGPWLVVTIRVLFWIYCAVCFLYSANHLVFLIYTNENKPLSFSPAWMFLLLNQMLTGTMAGSIAKSQPPDQRLPIIVAGITYQGLGFVLTLMFMVLILATLFQNGMPPASARPAFFMVVGSGGFTMLALITNAKSLPDGYGYFATHSTAKEVLQIVALWASIFIWMFTFWMFSLASLLTIWGLFEWHKDENGRVQHEMEFQMTWWALVFPNVGFALATGYIGMELESQGIQWISTALTLLTIVFWLFDLGMTIKSVAEGRVMWPGKDEDKED